MLADRDHAAFRERIERCRTFALVTHVNPDGDALGSEIGLADYLRARGREVVIVNHDPVPESLAFLDFGGTELRTYDAGRDDAVLAAVDRIVLLDNSAPDRLGALEGPLRRWADRVTCIDHHPTRGTPWAESLLDVGASATALLIPELLREAGYRPGRGAAEALYVGIATDTGFFRFNSTSPRVLRTAAELLELGVDAASCYREIYERNSPSFTRLLGLALAGLQLDADGRVVSVRITPEMVASAGANGADVSEMSTPLLAIDGVRIAVLFRELPDGRVKVSLRSKGQLDVHRLALGFGGGGHRNASGIVTEGTLEAVARRVLHEAVALARSGEGASQ